MNWPALFVTLSVLVIVFIPIGLEFRKGVLQRRKNEREYQAMLRQMSVSLSDARLVNKSRAELK